MKMQYHKIRNVEKEVCTCEQKIAYNVAFRLVINYDLEKKLKEAPTGICKSDLIYQAVQIGSKMCDRDQEITKKYNIDAIISALHSGLENYAVSGHHVLGSYEEIGKTLYTKILPIICTVF